MSPRISRIILFVKDLPRVAAFYQTHFNLKPIKPDEPGWLELKAAGCNLALHQAGKIPAGAGRNKSPAKIVFGVKDVHAAVKEMTARGVKFGKIHDCGGFYFADTKDPEGNPIQISSRGM